MNNKRTAGFWVIMIVGMLLLAVLVFGQAMSFINYDFAVSMGLQESREVIGGMGVAVNKGFGVGDTIIYLPLLLLFARGTPDFHFTSYTSYTLILTLFTLYGLWGLLYLYKNRKQLAR